MSDVPPPAPARALDPAVDEYLRRRLRVAGRRARWLAGLGAALALAVGVGGGVLADAARDPEGVVERLPLHTGREVQASVVRSLQAGAPSSARMAQRQIDRVPSEINAAVRQELEAWSTRSVKQIAERVPARLRELAEEDPEGLADALGAGPSSDVAAGGKAQAARVRKYLRAHMRPRLAEDLAPLDAGATAYLVATANAVEELGDDAPSAEQLLEHLVLGLLAHLIAPA